MLCDVRQVALCLSLNFSIHKKQQIASLMDSRASDFVPLSQEDARGGLEATLVHNVIKAVGGPYPMACHILGFEQGSVMNKGAPHSLLSTDQCQGTVPTRPECFIFLTLLLLPFNRGLGGNCSVDKQLVV